MTIQEKLRKIQEILGEPIIAQIIVDKGGNQRIFAIDIDDRDDEIKALKKLNSIKKKDFGVFSDYFG